MAFPPVADRGAWYTWTARPSVLQTCQLLSEEKSHFADGSKSEERKSCLPSVAGRASPVGGLRSSVVDSGVDSNSHSAIGTNVVLVGAVLAALGSDALQFFLCRSICVTNLNTITFFTNSLATVAGNDLLTDVASLETTMTN